MCLQQPGGPTKHVSLYRNANAVRSIMGGKARDISSSSKKANNLIKTFPSDTSMEKEEACL